MSLKVVVLTALVATALAIPSDLPGYHAPAHPTPYRTPAPYRASVHPTNLYRAEPHPTPAYEAPADPTSAYEAPTPATPTYRAPAPATPSYRAPAPATPSYQAPAHPRPAYRAPEEYPAGPVRYDNQYAVQDDYSGNDFGHQESRDGYDTQGSYRVLLPDGRRQTVNYYVNGDSGYVAEVTYEGEAYYPEQPYARGPSYGHA